MENNKIHLPIHSPARVTSLVALPLFTFRGTGAAVSYVNQLLVASLASWLVWPGPFMERRHLRFTLRI